MAANKLNAEEEDLHLTVITDRYPRQISLSLPDYTQQ